MNSFSFTPEIGKKSIEKINKKHQFICGENLDICDDYSLDIYQSNHSFKV